MKFGLIFIYVSCSICAFGQKEMYYEVGATHVTINEVMPFYVFSSGGVKDYSSTTNLSLGFGVSVPVLSQHAVLCGINYSRLNYSVRGEDDIFFYTLDETAQTIELPVNIRFFLSGGKWKPYVQSGLKYSFLLNSKGEAERSGGTTVDFSEDITELRNRNLLFAGFGAGISLDMKKSRVYLDWRFNFALNDFNNPDKRYSNQELTGDVSHIDSDIRLNYSVITLGFIPKSMR